MKRGKFIMLIFLSILSLNLISQNSTKIAGKIVDSITGLPIALTSLYLTSDLQGTISNNEGVFLFKINHPNATDSIVISCIGYQTIKRSVSELDGLSTQLFKLVPLAYSLEGVFIKPIPEAKEIIIKAMENMEINYAQNPFLADCYFSEFINEDGSYVRAMELALQQYNKGGFPNPLIAIPMQQIKVLQKRKSADNTKLVKSPTNRCFSLNYLLLTSNLRNYFYKIKNLTFTLDSVSMLGDIPIYIITSTNESEKTKYFISQDGYKVLQLEFHWRMSLPKYRLDDYYFSINKTDGKLIFKESGKKMYPAYASNILEIYYYQNKSDTDCWHKQVITSELLYHNINTFNVKEIDKSERLDILLYPNIYKLDIPYNEEYWTTTNFVEESTNRKQIYDLINDKNNKSE